MASFEGESVCCPHSSIHHVTKVVFVHERVRFWIRKIHIEFDAFDNSSVCPRIYTSSRSLCC